MLGRHRTVVLGALLMTAGHFFMAFERSFLLALALLARTAPASVSALMIGAYYLSVFVGSLVSGRLGVLYEQIPLHQFWMLHAAIVGSGGIVVLLSRRWLVRALEPAG